MKPSSLKVRLLHLKYESNGQSAQTEAGGSSPALTMNETYRPIVEGLLARSVRTYFQGVDQLVISRQYPALPFGSNSFWITNIGETWYLSTWSPTCYRVPPEADLIGLCEVFVHFGTQAQAEIPAEIVKQFGVIRLTDEEAAEL
jgi:hypothetical protein